MKKRHVPLLLLPFELEVVRLSVRKNIVYVSLKKIKTRSNSHDTGFGFVRPIVISQPNVPLI